MRSPAPAASGVSSGRSPHGGIFRKDGEYWTVGYGDKALRLKDSKGFSYLAHLLRHPGTEFHVLDLVGGIASQSEGIHVGGLGDAGELLDDRAKAAYRQRLSDLREELEEAKELGDVARAENAEQEIDALTSELTRAVGLGGRNRRAASASERARQSVTKTIRAVTERIAQSDALLGNILSRCIKTGTFCSYWPDPDYPIAWEFAGEDGDSAGRLSEQAASNGDSDAARTVELQASPAVLGVSTFPLAEQTAFVGRECERSTIRTAIDRARTGQGLLVMLSGEPGVGKTRRMRGARERRARRVRCSMDAIVHLFANGT